MKAYKVLAEDLFGSEYSEFVFADNEELALKIFNEQFNQRNDLDVISVQYMYYRTYYHLLGMKNN